MPRIREGVALVGLLLWAACSAPPAQPARWLIARRDVVATDDPQARLRRGFGIAASEERQSGAGVIVRSIEGRWYPREAFTIAEPFEGPAPAATLPATSLPEGLGADERWLDVVIAEQRLIAYEGRRVVRAMKISSGVGEEGAPYSTPKGSFRIYAKLRQATMASPPPVAGTTDAHPYRFEGVPDVQYFNREVALHGAYWHRRFGERVSHGCVNLAPADADWLFAFTAPHLTTAQKELAATEGKGGTLVRVR